MSEIPAKLFTLSEGYVNWRIDSQKADSETPSCAPVVSR